MSHGGLPLIMPLFDRGGARGRPAADPGNAIALRSKSPHQAPLVLPFLDGEIGDGASVTLSLDCVDLRLFALLVSMLDWASYKGLDRVSVLL
jgi:hypothetical protein